MNREREKMVEVQLIRRGISDPNVLDAMRKIPRENFLPKSARAYAYVDGPVAIGEDQTISQPFIVAYMCQELRMTKHSTILEIGTGSGYETAVLALCAKEVYTVEFRPALAEQARRNLATLGLVPFKPPAGIGEKKIECVPNFRVGDGHEGWPEHAPYDGIIVSACFRTVPKPLIDQLKIGGRLVAPVGTESDQILILIEKNQSGIRKTELMAVAFVSAAGGEDEPN